MVMSVSLESLFSSSAHRWQMGLRRGDDFTEFCCPHAATGTVLAERAECLSAGPESYAALLPEGVAAFDEMQSRLSVPGHFEPATLESPWDRLLRFGRGYEPDVVWLMSDGAGEYLVAGGVVCFPSSWSLPEKLGQPLSLVHQIVPELNATLGRAISTFLGKLEPGTTWRRENWGLSGDARRNHHPTKPRTPLQPAVTAEGVWIRIEHQRLFKLPETGGIVFGIRLEIVPLTDVLADRQVTLQLARQLQSMPDSIAEYKGLSQARPALISLLQNV